MTSKALSIKQILIDAHTIVICAMITFVLVPGAWLGSWVWNRVSPLLQERGHEPYAVTLTGMGDRVHLASKDVGIETAIQDVLNVIKYDDLDDFVLVGHSFAGKVVAAVADRVPERVKMILYVDAFRPAKNIRTPQGSFDPSEYGTYEGGTIPFSKEILDMIGKDVQGADRQWMLSKATPWPKRLANEPVALSEKFDSLNAACIFCAGGGDPIDEILSGKWGKVDGPYKVIESGHYPMVTNPKELTDDILSLVSL
jgi:pimeloyl-ACP methyl ester carboxylesterase